MVKSKAKKNKLAVVEQPLENNVDYDLAGFKVFKWKIANTSEDDEEIVHHFFIKAHKVKSDHPKKPNERTLFMINIPPFILARHIKTIFSTYGNIKDVYFHENPSISIPSALDKHFPASKDFILGYKVAYIVFNDKTAVDAIVENCSNDRVTEIDKIVSGIEKWTTNYNSQILNPKDLEETVKKFMEHFEKEEFRKKEELKNNDGVPDEEGWTTVSTKGKKRALRRTEKSEEELKKKKRRFEKQLLNFTPTQIKETKARQLVELKRKFDEDKERVALMKQQRKFKPF